MQEYDNNMRGVLFKNNRKESDRYPDYTGNCEIEGVEYWMSAWIKDSKNGNRFMSFSFKPKEERNNSQQQGTQQGNNYPDDDLPF